jgi:hypothetical protein
VPVRRRLRCQKPAHRRRLLLAARRIRALIVRMLRKTRTRKRLRSRGRRPRCSRSGSNRVGRGVHGKAGRSSAELARNGGVRPKIKRRGLVAEASADRNALAARRTATVQHCGAALGLHTRAKSVRLYTAMAVRLKCALGHRNALLFSLEFCAALGSLCEPRPELLPFREL